MIKAILFKLEMSGWQCNNPECKHNPKYHYNIIGNVFHLKQEQICLKISLQGSHEIYCRDCIDVVYKKLKPILDSKLWVMG